MRVNSEFTALETILGHRFKRPGLLQQALTHRSFGATHNERLEFLGDSVVNLCVAKLLYTLYPELDEGVLSRTRANLVKQDTLHRLALSLALPDLLRLGEGEARSGGRQRASILADVFEALLGALYIDAGLAPCEALVERLYTPLIRDTQHSVGNLGVSAKDAKTALQEWLQGRKLPLPSYDVTAIHGAAHEQTFEVTATLAKPAQSAIGEGASKRAAEQVAATALLQLLLQGEKT
jgi:ribonuclease III